ncbi:MAG: thioredoxin domain-containing protein [Actinomycetota bacterium]|nr:thioredoxin domain-containing protein [Actinomycetota bacterium]
MFTVDDESFGRDVLQADGAVAVDFWAPWCHPCEAVTRLLEQLETEGSGRLAFAKLDVDANPVTAGAYDVLSIPAVIVFQGGEPRATITGARPRQYFERMLAPWL